MAKYDATAYLRLSYTADQSEESDSITNQKKLVEDFVAAHPDITLVNERVDDGYSGVLFDRPAFQEMMQDITQGTINCVIVKDLSRLGREYIETGRYLRQIFPAYGVRFIAINDGIDTANEHNGDDLNISLKNLLNDTYCRDISVKTRSALLSKRKNGEYVGRKKSPTRRTFSGDVFSVAAAGRTYTDRGHGGYTPTAVLLMTGWAFSIVRVVLPICRKRGCLTRF